MVSLTPVGSVSVSDTLAKVLLAALLSHAEHSGGGQGKERSATTTA
jgi:hypothetical protein